MLENAMDEEKWFSTGVHFRKWSTNQRSYSIGRKENINCNPSNFCFHMWSRRPPWWSKG